MTKKVKCGASDCKIIFDAPAEHPGPFYCSIECSIYGKYEKEEANRAVERT